MHVIDIRRRYLQDMSRLVKLDDKLDGSYVRIAVFDLTGQTELERQQLWML